MATTVNGPTRNWGHSYFIYTTSSTNTAYTITISEAGVSATRYIDGYYELYKPGSSEISTKSTFRSIKGKKVLVTNKAFSFTRTHTAQTKEVFFRVEGDPVNGTASYYSNAKKTITIPAKPSYTVSYNANSGSGAPANQTKWYDETLSLSTSKPTKNGYIFRGWATSQVDANVGTVAYAAGANYTGNAALTLYAVWELAYTSPIINQLIVERCKSDGTDSDEGTYARISFDWSVYINDASRYYGGTVCPYTNSVADITIKVGEITRTISSTTSTSVNEIIDTSVTDPFNVDVEYPVSITVVDTRVDVSNNTKTVTSRLLTPIFILDANADATAVGILKSAPDDGQGVYLGGDVHAEGNTGYFEELFVKKDADSSGGSRLRPLVAEWRNLDNQTIAKSTIGEVRVLIAKSGYTPIGVIGWDIDGGSSHASNNNISSLVPLAMRLIVQNNTTYGYAQLRNNSTSPAYVNMRFHVLYMAN